MPTSARHVSLVMGVTILALARPTVLVADGPPPKAYPALGPLPAVPARDASLVEMGRRLFFDPRISGDAGLSCATCHDPAQGFTRQKNAEGKPMQLSDAYPGIRYFRNTPTLINTAFKANFPDVGWGWDGRMGANLNDVVRDQLTETMIMNMDMRLMHERMKQDPVYVSMCQENFGGECSSGRGRKALVAFMESLVSTDAPFDTGELSDAASRGRALFEGKAGCIRCHNGPYFSDGEPHNTGVPENLDVFRDPLRHIGLRAVLSNHGVPKADIWRRDVGYFLVSKDYGDVGKFITPTLRELVRTAPYMHNGVLGTLAEVVEFYDQGGGHDDPLAYELKPLGLSENEESDLVAFLESLSSRTPVTVDPVEIPETYEPIEDWLGVHN
ncbi:MAG: photosynthetic protein synthase I [Planctomycetes bacterium]|nr:photosynthetic protein synthase I [Planctomycetota bacterium]